ncbi:MAG: M23 family metallopeptidase [Alphaproteobacteria bacterium]
MSPADLLEFGNQTVRSRRGPGFFERHAAVRRGESFASMLAMVDVSRERSQAFEDAARPIFDLANIEPRRSLSLFFETDGGQLAAIEYAIDGSRVLVVERDPEGELRARIARTPTSIEIRGVSGTISGGLHVDCSEAGIPDRIVRELVDIFAWDVDFDSMQPGDSFRALYEVAVGEQGEVVQTGAIVAAEVSTAGRVFRAMYHAEDDGAGAYYDPEGHSLDRGMLRYPLEFVRISSGFSNARFHPVLHRTRAHKGVDFAAPTGTPVRAVADGWVTQAGWQGGLGYAIRAVHGGETPYTSVYGHLSRISRGVRDGEAVRKGEIIGYVGSTGLASGPHLHFSILEGEEYVDPLGVTPPPRIVQSVSLDEGFQRSRGVLLAALDRLAGDGPVRLTRVSGPRVETPERPLLISY